MKSTQSLHSAALESASIFNAAVGDCAATSGLFMALRDGRTLDDLISTMRFARERRVTIESFLNVLAHQGFIVKRQSHDGLAYFQTNEGFVQEAPLKRDAAPYRHVGTWFGDTHVDLIRSSNRAFLGEDLSFFRDHQDAIRFDRDFESEWRTNLTNPLYEFGRERCVRSLCECGNRFLDLACGLGLGSMRLAQFCEGPAFITAIDKSFDFLQIAKHSFDADAQIRFIHRDLNNGLPSLPACQFDGVLFNGAFHFIKEKPAMLKSIYGLLRPGGRFALGHCFSLSGFDDEAMHQFYFSLLQDKAYPVSWPDMKTDVTFAGFDIIDEFHRGSHSYLIAQKPPFMNEHAL